MDGIEMDAPTQLFDDSTFEIGVNDDFCSSVLSRFGQSEQEDHHHLCAVLGAMSQELKDQNLPSTPIAYFGATCSSLDRLSSELEPASHVVDALITILSLLLPRIPPAVLKKKRDYLKDLLIRVLRLPSASEGAVMAALKCVAHLLTIRDGVNWSDKSQLYGALLGFVTDSRPKVRRQSNLCLRDVLRSLHGTSAAPPASEGITNIFEKFLLLAGGSSTNATDAPKGAQDVLYVLDALKDCLPLMSLKYATSVLKYFKTLLELHQPVVTRRVTNCLNFLCIQPNSEVSADALLDLLCSVAINVSTHETSVDSMTFTARLLDVGMKKVYAVNRQTCTVKLPVVFNALRDIMASEHEETLYAATNALKSLINTCVDETLTRQGVDQIVTISNMDSRRSGPTIIEKVCATIESLLDYRYSVVWDMALQVVLTMFDKLGGYSSHLLSKTLKSLADMQKLPDEDFPYRKQLHECIGSAVGAMGPETFLEILPLGLDSKELSKTNAWLFPILKQYTVGARLSYFTESILGTVGQIKQKSRKLELEGRILSSRSMDGLVYSLWSLLPSFCNYPVDTADSFNQLAKVLCNALHEEPNIRGIVCSSLEILINQNKKVLEGKDVSVSEVGVAQQRAMNYYTTQVAENNLGVLRASARELLSVLSAVILKSTADDGGCLQAAISDIASISDKEVVTKIYKSTMQKLLMVTREASKDESSKKSIFMQIDDSSNEMTPVLMRARLLGLAVSLLPGLNAKEVDLLFTAIRPALEDDEGLIQKKAYKVLASILQNSEGFLSSKLEELLKLLVEVLPSCHFSAKRPRLDCLYFLIVHVSKENSEQRWNDIISSFLTEIILSLKEANKKTRNRAYDMLVQIGHACSDEESGGKKESLYEFFNMVAGGLAGETPHMVSAAVKGLARLAYEFSDLVATAYNVLPSTFLLLQRKNREIIKANLGFLKVLVAKSQADWLQTHLKSMVEGLLKWQADTKNHFKAKVGAFEMVLSCEHDSKVKLLLEMIIKKCGLEAVRAVMPEEHMKLFTNIRKINERKDKKRSVSSEESKSQLSRATTSRLSRWNHSRIFSDFGDQETEGSDAEYMDMKTVSGRRSKATRASSLWSKRSQKGAKSLPEDLFDQFEDEPLDLLDQHRTRSSLKSSELKREADSDDEPDVDTEGRLIIHEGGKSKRRSSTEADLDSRSEAGSYRSANSTRKNEKRRKTSESGWAYTGSEYGSKKAGGDLKKKGKFEPYAYWPLDRKMMSRRPEHRAAARKGMVSVVKMTKKLEGKSASSLLGMKSLKLKKVQKRHKK